MKRPRKTKMGRRRVQVVVDEDFEGNLGFVHGLLVFKVLN